MTDLLDQRLSEAGRRWRATQPPAPLVPVDRLAGPAARPRWWRPLVAAAAAVAIAGAGVVALSHRGGSDAGTPSSRITAHATGTAKVTIPWQPLPAGHPAYRRVNGHAVTPYDRVSATGTISGRTRPGDTLVFDAILESSTDLPLDPCPDFNIAFGTHSWHTWQLNCAQVPYRDDQGRPYLPAFENVRFRMEVTVPDEPGRQKVLWTLDGPQQMPGFYGLVRVS